MLREWIRYTSFRHASAAMVGTMVGVGIFGIPFVFAKAGFWVGTVWLVGIAGIIALFSLMFTELMLRTDGQHQLPGYAEVWLGPWAKRIVTFALILGIYGALLAYTIVVGQFLHNVFSQFFTIDPELYGLLFTAILAPILLFRLRTVAFVEQALTVLFISIVFIVVLVGAWKVVPSNYTYTTPFFWFLPYGVLLFAFSGLTTLPIVRRILVGKEHGIRPAVLSAVGLVAVLYFVFAAVVVGVSGEITSPDALAGLFDFLGLPVVILGSLFGILTISTSYLMLGTGMYEIFHIDYRMRRWFAWPLVVLPPLVFFFSGLRNFIDVIGTVGAVTVGLTSIVFILAYLKARRHSHRQPELVLRVPVVVWYVLLVVFSAGIGYVLLL